MNSQPLYDLAPLAQLMLLGIVIALGPVAWVGWRHRGSARGHRLQALTVLTLFLTFDLVLFGAFTRLTDSGLGCPDWPGCYGSASPVGARADIAAAQEAMPTGPVTHGKAWVEMIHRYLATGVGVLIIVLTVATWLQWRRARADSTVSPPVMSPWWRGRAATWRAMAAPIDQPNSTIRWAPRRTAYPMASSTSVVSAWPRVDRPVPTRVPSAVFR